MKRYLLRYFYFWLPAILVATFFNNSGMPSQIAQWFTAFFMVFAWAVNTGMLAYHHPRNTLALALAYGGLHILLITAFYRTTGAAHAWLRQIAGLFSFRPLGIFIKALLDFTIQHEMVVTAALTGCCLLGWFCGVVYRQMRPNPYKPKFYG